jgi:polyisoprenoid-binding protein YceI
MTRYLTGIIVLLLLSTPVLSQQLFITHSGKASFASNAPLEVINATSELLEGAINLDDRSFAFTIDNNTFKGFNSSLQQEHFYENYMEVQDYPTSTFQGKIIGDFDPASKSEQVVRAKGSLKIHGVEQERIIKGTMKIDGDKLLVKADFTLPLEDHDIKIPRIVYQKIAEIIDVSINAELIRKTGK